jgi:hypothetical protein
VIETGLDQILVVEPFAEVFNRIQVMAIYQTFNSKEDIFTFLSDFELE